MPQTIDAQLLYVPPTPELRFLPEGPYPAGEGLLSWVAIQHGAEATSGSLNLLDLATRENRQYDLPGRPGFAFATSREGTFVVGLERRLGLFELASGKFMWLAENLDSAVDNTIVNDAVCFADGIVLGFKELEFKAKKAGLYFWRRSDRQMIQLRDDQICSNGKIIVKEGDQFVLLDIDTPSKTVQRYRLDPQTGTLSEPEVALDLQQVEAYPDGMIASPDGQSVIIAFYNPGDPEAGETRQYRLADGALEIVWKTPGSPRNTCPQLVNMGGSIKLVITTATEDMEPAQQKQHPHAGCLFVADTPFEGLPETPQYQI
jgi:sugar lactone lactonase YvrE